MSFAIIGDSFGDLFSRDPFSRALTLDELFQYVRGQIDPKLRTDGVHFLALRVHELTDIPYDMIVPAREPRQPRVREAFDRLNKDGTAAKLSQELWDRWGIWGPDGRAVVRPPAPDAATPARGVRGARESAEQTSPVARAIALLLDFDRHGKRITVKKLADMVGCSRPTLYRDPQFRATRKALRGNRQGVSRPRGWKDATGNMDGVVGRLPAKRKGQVGTQDEDD